MNRKLVYTLICVAAVLGIGVAGILMYAANVRQTINDGKPIAVPADNSQVTIKGMQVCLPHKSRGAMQTMECAIGLQDSVGNYYGLRNLGSPLDLPTYDSTLPVTVMGTFVKDTSGNYDIVGYINVKSIVNSGPTPLPGNQNSAPSNNASPSNDETANWKTYINTKYGFELKYPADSVEVLSAQERKEKLDFATTPSCTAKNRYLKDEELKDCLRFVIYVDHIVAMSLGETAQKIKIGGLQGEKLVLNRQPISDSNTSVYYVGEILAQVEKNGYWYKFGLTFHTDEASEAEILFGKLISTFKFTK